MHICICACCMCCNVEAMDKETLHSSFCWRELRNLKDSSRDYRTQSSSFSCCYSVGLLYQPLLLIIIKLASASQLLSLRRQQRGNTSRRLQLCWWASTVQAATDSLMLYSTVPTDSETIADYQRFQAAGLRNCMCNSALQYWHLSLRLALSVLPESRSPF